MAKREIMAFATDRDSKRFLVRLDCSGINPLIVQCDGIPVTRFDRERTFYLDVSDVINWHEKEIAETNGKSGNPDLLRNFKAAIQKFRSGDVAFV